MIECPSAAWDRYHASQEEAELWSAGEMLIDMLEDHFQFGRDGNRVRLSHKRSSIEIRAILHDVSDDMIELHVGAFCSVDQGATEEDTERIEQIVVGSGLAGEWDGDGWYLWGKESVKFDPCVTEGEPDERWGEIPSDLGDKATMRWIAGRVARDCLVAIAEVREEMLLVYDMIERKEP